MGSSNHTLKQYSSDFTLSSQYPFFYAGEERRGFAAEEFRHPTGAKEIAPGFFQPQFNIFSFTKFYVLFGEDLLSCEGSTLGVSEKKESEEKNPKWDVHAPV